ncbi:MAG: hypothetical protein M1838_001998 [Thelocarpon superellum]|nr:MAG: hypothetical protein M1838_001998 [Thelocarpon superellum]
MTFRQQIWTLTVKTLMIVLGRHAFSTVIRAFVLPVAFMLFLSYARNLFIPNSVFGIGSATSLRTLSAALGAAGGDRDTVVFVNNGLAGGDIDAVIHQVASTVTAAGKTVKYLQDPAGLLETCASSLLGVSSCYAAAVFYSSPTEGPGGIWNYTLRADGALGLTINVGHDTNDAEIYTLPFQHAIDASIAATDTSTTHVALPQNVTEYMYTSETPQQRADDIRVRYMSGIIQVIGVAFFIAFVGVIYQSVGFMASERELGMSQLIEAMTPGTRRWQPQLARLVAHHLAFDIIYLPGWIIMAIILDLGVFAETSMGVLIVFHLLAGLSLSSLALFGGSFFHKAQLSGISITIICLLFGILAQVVSTGGSGAIAILGLLFPPMTYVYFTILMARFQAQNAPTNLVQAAPESPWALPGIALWVFLIIQIVAYPALGALIERSLYGTMSKGRTVSSRPEDSPTSVELSHFSRHYRPNWFFRHVAPLYGQRKELVKAVEDLTLTVHKGQIMVLLGANGSGKTTTLEAIAGLNQVTRGAIDVDSTGGLGICPQKNVLWDELTVDEHVWVFDRLKSTGAKSSRDEIRALVTACDLDRKRDAKAKTLSGGQKRKLNLAMMFTGGSRVCAVDEVSSGLDPLSRRKIWDILLSERGKRTIILTTHFLDEADLLADHIAILSKGTLRAEGSAVELKHRLGGGYHIHLGHAHGLPALPDLKVVAHDSTYNVATSGDAARLMDQLDQAGITDYQVSGPTIEDVFLKLADEVASSASLAAGDVARGEGSTDGEEKTPGAVIISDRQASEDDGEVPQGLRLLTGRRIGMPRQAWVLFRKRLAIVQRNYLPSSAAFLLPVIAAGLVTLFLHGFQASGCAPTDNISVSDVSSLASEITQNLDLVVGPPSRLGTDTVDRIAATLPRSGQAPANASGLTQAIHIVDTLADFNAYISRRFANVTPGGIYLGDASSPPTLAYQGDGGIYTSIITQNALDTLLSNLSISTQFASFDTPWQPDAGKSLQLIVYFGLVMCAYPAFFALYPTLERLRQVRSLHYSNGVRTLPLWFAYTAFDFCIVFVASAIAVIIFATSSSAWYHVGYLFPVFFLYGLASTLLAYVISLFSRSQLAAFAFVAGGQAVMFLLYFIAYLNVQTYAPVDKRVQYVNVVHFAFATITPSGNLIRAMFIALNVLAITCRNKALIPYPGDIEAYGGPILYLSVQSLLLFGVLLWWDGGSFVGLVRPRSRTRDAEEKETPEPEIVEEARRVSQANDGLRVLDVTKAFGSNVAVDDVTFGVPRGEVFALLGPNGAGKSTTISLIRGDMRASTRSGDILVEETSVLKHRAAARSHLGVCPQFDAMDQLTVVEQLRFYARIRGVSDVAHNVGEVIKAVGLEAFAERMAATLSGGNKRKLSLGVALMGNPSVLLLDEPSSGMDAAAKRVMWKTLAAVVPGRSIVLTTHSMEEADALADRAGIMAKKMLAIGTSDYLRRKHGDKYYAHLVTKTAPHTSSEEMERIRQWILQHFEGVEVEEKTYHGQIRFSVAARPSASMVASSGLGGDQIDAVVQSPKGGIGGLFTMLEEHKEELGLEYYSISRTTLDQVFLTIVGKHHVEEENSGAERKRSWRRFWRRDTK